MHDDVADDGDPTLDRRSLIKKIGVAGAVAWTAPVVMDSVLSPAAAESVEFPNPGPPPGPPFTFRETWRNVEANSSGPGYTTYGVGQQLDSTGWVVTGDAGSSVDAIVVPGYGSTGFSTPVAIELGGSTFNAGGIVRTISLPLAATYRLTFEWANPSVNAGSFALSNGGPLLGDSLAAGAGLQSYTNTFTVGAGNVTLAFDGTGSNNGGAIIGRITITTPS